jgi:hypothetical protein
VREKTTVTAADVLPSRLPDLQSGKEESTLADARRYVHNLQTEAAAHQVASSPPSSTP